MSRLALSRICPVLYRTSKDSWPQYFCLFVPSTCLALSRTCPVPSRVRYHEGNSQGPHSFNSRSYAEDVTSVTSGASQGPHSFNLVFVCLFVCLFVCVTPGAIPYLSRTVPYQQRQLATIYLFVCAIDMHRLHAIPGLVDRRPSQPASGISASHTNPHKMLLH